MKFDLSFDLPSGWELKTVEQLIKDKVIEKPLDGNHGGIHPKASDYVEEGVPFVMASDLNAGRVNFNSCKFISKEQATNLRKGFSKVGDVLISHKATIGRTAIVQDNEHEFIMLTPQVTYYRVKDETKLNNVYLKAYFDSRFFQSILGLWAGSGSTRAYLGITGQLKLPVIVPPIDCQGTIANQVGSINDKIELNRQTNQTLEQIAQAIFKSWFVDFEPTRAKIKAKKHWQAAQQNIKASSASDYAETSDKQHQHTTSLQEAMNRAAMAAISGKTEAELNNLPADTLQQLRTTAELFPDTLVESELGEIPAGWEVTLNGEVMDVRDGTHDSPKQSEIGYPLVTSKHITTGELNIKDTYLISEEDYENVNKRSNVEKGDILLTMIGTVGIPYLVIQSKVQFAIKNIGLFRTSEAIDLRNYFYLLLKSKGMQQYLEARMAGTTQKYLSLKTLRTIEMILPTHEMLSEFNKAVVPLLNKIFDGLGENESLSDIRDTVLPKLLSGDLDINKEVT